MTATIALLIAAPAATAAERKVTVKVSDECIAPVASDTNFCRVSGTLPQRGLGGSDIVWEVALFFNDHWRIQFQAFSETTTAECQYPIRVWGSDQPVGLDPAVFVASSGLDLGITPTEYPTVTLRVDQIRIDTERTTCG